MYPTNNNGAGAQWAFATVMVIVVLALTLGILISNSEWFQPEIAQAKADGMNKGNDIEYQKSLLDLEKYKSDIQTAIERTKQSLEEQKVAAQQFANFRQGFYNTLNSGVLILSIVLGVVIISWGISASLKSYKLALLNAESARIMRAVAKPAYRQPSAAALLARKRERKQRRDRLTFKHTSPFWPDNGKKEKRTSNDLPWAN